MTQEFNPAPFGHSAMIASHNTRMRSLLLLLLPACSMACSTVEILRYPDFYSPDIKRIAVLPLRCFPSVDDPSIGVSLSSKIESALVQNRTYEIYTRQYLQELFCEDDLLDSGVIKSEAAQRIRLRASVDALICGSVTRCEMRSEERRKMRPDGTISVKLENTAVLDVTVVLVDTKTGHHLGAVSAHGNDDCDGTTPRYTPRDLLHRIEVQVTKDIIEQLAAKRVRCSIKQDAVQVAQNRYGLNWDYTREVSPQGTFYVVVSLPDDFDKNNYTLIIASEGSRQNLETREGTWSKSQQQQEYIFEADAFVNQVGQGHFNAMLYYRQKMIAKRSFIIASIKK